MKSEQSQTTWNPIFAKRIETTSGRWFHIAFGQMRLSLNGSKHSDGFWLSVTSLYATLHVAARAKHRGTSRLHESAVKLHGGAPLSARCFFCRHATRTGCTETPAVSAGRSIVVLCLLLLFLPLSQLYDALTPLLWQPVRSVNNVAQSEQSHIWFEHLLKQSGHVSPKNQIWVEIWFESDSPAV